MRLAAKGGSNSGTRVTSGQLAASGTLSATFFFFLVSRHGEKSKGLQEGAFNKKEAKEPGLGSAAKPTADYWEDEWAVHCTASAAPTVLVTVFRHLLIAGAAFGVSFGGFA